MAGPSAILLLSLGVLFVLTAVQAANYGYGPKPCPPGQEHNKCGSSCPATCDNLGKKMVCNEMCKPGCVCKRGTVLDSRGNCVRKEECCKGNTVYSDNGSDCGRTCPTRFPKGYPCPKEGSAGCFCKRNYVRLGDKCVLRRDCPKIPPHY